MCETVGLRHRCPLRELIWDYPVVITKQCEVKSTLDWLRGRDTPAPKQFDSQPITLFCAM